MTTISEHLPISSLRTPGAETLQTVQDVGRERLHPSLTNPNWLVLRKRRQLFKEWLKNLPGRDLQVLDVGGRIQPYRVLLGDRCARYVAVDLREGPLVNVVSGGEHLPFPEEQFDLVFCTQVLEYAPHPHLVLDEIRRSLKKGGFLFLSAPSVFPQDSPSEYWRFLPSALKQLLAKFSRCEVVAEGNSLVGLLRTLNVCLVLFARPRFLGSLLRFSLVPLLNLLGLVLQSAAPPGEDSFSANFSALAQK